MTGDALIHEFSESVHRQGLDGRLRSRQIGVPCLLAGHDRLHHKGYPGHRSLFIHVVFSCTRDESDIQQTGLQIYLSLAEPQNRCHSFRKTACQPEALGRFRDSPTSPHPGIGGLPRLLPFGRGIRGFDGRWQQRCDDVFPVQSRSRGRLHACSFLGRRR